YRKYFVLTRLVFLSKETKYYTVTTIRILLHLDSYIILV
ncbi:uncharacterized protein METZ01_LOCUS92904, partial [marine metagenome]